MTKPTYRYYNASKYSSLSGGQQKITLRVQYELFLRFASDYIHRIVERVLVWRSVDVQDYCCTIHLACLDNILNPKPTLLAQSLRTSQATENRALAQLSQSPRNHQHHGLCPPTWSIRVSVKEQGKGGVTTISLFVSTTLINRPHFPV